MPKVKFLICPTGKFGLAYSKGDEAELKEVLVAELVESGYAELLPESKEEADLNKVVEATKAEAKKGKK